jgi:Uma2 family endonuclease
MYVTPESLPRLSPEEYFEWENEQETRHQLVDGYLYAMTVASLRHDEIAMNVGLHFMSISQAAPAGCTRATSKWILPVIFIIRIWLCAAMIPDHQKMNSASEIPKS